MNKVIFTLMFIPLLGYTGMYARHQKKEHSEKERIVIGSLTTGALGAIIGGAAGKGTGAAIGGPVGLVAGGVISKIISDQKSSK